MRMIKPEDIDFDIFVDEETMTIQAIVDVYDAVPVVRCKDCKNSSDKTGISVLCKKLKLLIPGEWYCADGKRRKDV